MCVFAVESLTKIDRAIADTLKPAGQQAEHLGLALGQLRSLGRHPPAHRVGEVGGGERPGRDQGVPGGGDHLVGRGVLGHEGGGAGLEGREELLVAGVHGQHHDAGVVPGRTQRADQVETGAVGEPHVGDDHVRGELLEAGEPLGHGGGLAGDDEVLLPLEGVRQALTDQVVVVDQEYPRGLLGHHSPFVREDTLGRHLNLHDGPAPGSSPIPTGNVENGVDALGALPHDGHAVGVVAAVTETGAVVADGQARQRRARSSSPPTGCGRRRACGRW